MTEPEPNERAKTDGATVWPDGSAIRRAIERLGMTHYHHEADGLRAAAQVELAALLRERDEAQRWGKVHVKRAEDAEREWREAVVQRDEVLHALREIMSYVPENGATIRYGYGNAASRARAVLGSLTEGEQ